MIIGAVSMPQGGKTTVLRMLVRHAAARDDPPQRIRIYDSDQSFVGSGPYRSIGYYRSSVTQTDEVPRVAVFHPEEPSLESLLELAALVGTEGGILVVDELPDFLPNTIPDEHFPPELRRLTLKSRRTPQCGLWWSAHALSMVHRVVRRATRILYVFRQGDYSDLRTVREFPFGSVIAPELPGLPDLHYFKLDKTGNALREPPRATVLHPHPSDFAGRRRG